MGEMSEPAGGEEGAGRESGLLVASTDCFRFLELAGWILAQGVETQRIPLKLCDGAPYGVG